MKYFNKMHVVLLFFLLSCSMYSLPKSYIQDCNSSILCKGIENIIRYAKKDTAMQKYLFSNADTLNFTYKIDTLIQEGMYTGLFSSEIVKILVDKERISKDCAFNKLFHKNLQNEFIRINCIKIPVFDKPKVKISFNYHPEYRILVTIIRKIRYQSSYSRGYAYLARLDENGKNKIIKTTYWME